MSLTQNLFIGWYAEFTPSKEKVEYGTAETIECSADAKHWLSPKTKTRGKFCIHCGAPLIKVNKPKMKQISPAHHVFEETCPIELEFMTNGRATAGLMKVLRGSRGIFPEYMDDSSKGLTRVMLPGFIEYTDISGYDGFTHEINMDEFTRPSEDWVTALNQVFGCTDLVLKFGIIKELY